MPPDQAPEIRREDGRLGRRLVVLRLAGLGTATAALPGCLAAPPGYPGGPVLVTTDPDPSDGVGHGGRRRAYAPASRAATDADPSDGVGHGCFGPAPARRASTDNDPSDDTGRGRGVHRAPSRRAASDHDPSDDVGRGRRWR